jgi:hypothetical protein
MAHIINLRRARKNKKREDDEATATINRAKFGTPKAERNLQDALKQQDAKRLDAHKRDTE